RTDCNDRCASTSQRSPAGFSDSDANDLCPLAADLDGLALCCREPGEDQLGDHSACESVREQQRLGEATRIDGQQRQRIACFRAEMRLSSERCHAEQPRFRPITRPVRRPCGLSAGAVEGARYLDLCCRGISPDGPYGARGFLPGLVFDCLGTQGPSPLRPPAPRFSKLDRISCKSGVPGPVWMTLTAAAV